jgi:hypothetical protein
MSPDRINLVREWLAKQGDSWKQAVREASCLLLEDYLKRCKIVPVELHRLAATLNAEVVRLNDFEGEAMLIPKHAGFRVIVNASLNRGRYRASVAHELAHTLFYSNPGESLPRRLQEPSRREEFFCFDVARHMLAPIAHLEAAGILNENDPAVTFAKLTEILLLSRPWAARIMLADYALARGIAGRWVRGDDGRWSLARGSSTATPSLSDRDKRELRAAAAKYLQSPERNPQQRIIAVPETSGHGVFVLVIKA